MALDRSIRPLTTEEIDFEIPKIESFELNNINVFYVERHNLPIIRLSAIFEGGSRLDPDGKKGLVNLFTMMLDEGAGKFNALELSDEFELLGSNFDSSCSNDAIYIGCRSIKENFEKTLDLLCTIINEPRLDANDFEREKRKILTRLIQLKDDGEEIANNIFDYLLFKKNHPYAFPVIGYEEDIINITINDIVNYYRNNFLTKKLHILVAGNITGDELKLYIEKYFGSWQGNEFNTLPKNDISLTQEKKIYFFHKPDTVQTELRIGYLTEKRNKKNYFSKLILNLILGGQFSSRINLNLRENKGYTYGAFSTFSYLKDVGMFFVSTSVNIENTANAVKEIFYELNEIKKGVSEDELDFAKSSLIRKYPSNFENIRQIVSALNRLVTSDLTVDDIYNYVSNIKKVSLVDVKKAAEEHITPDNCIIILVGDKEKIIPQLKELNFAEVIEVDSKGEPIIKN
ncbi:MAG: M16 family metallopeptidase [Syntrophothermus sp.]